MKGLTPWFLALSVVGCSGPPVTQPIAFNHRLHTIENEMACDICHRYYAERAHSGRPVIAICLDCHEEALTDSPEEEKIRTFAEQGEEIPWRRIYVMPRHVRYSHARHVTGAGLECQTCHGSIGQAERPPSRPEVDLSMDFCVGCHWERGISTDCILCHR